MQKGLAKQLHKNDDYKVICTDKNCGLAFIEMACLTEKGVTEHLSNHNVYQKMSERNARAQLRGVELLVDSFASRLQQCLTKAEYTYLKRGLKQNKNKLAKFYTTIKVHKNPHTLRPIVAQCGTVISVLSSWLDYKLKKLLPFVSTYIKDSRDFKIRLNNFNSKGRLPANAKLVTADAVSMYTNIDTEHGLKVLRLFLEELKSEGNLPTNFDIDMIVEAARLVMCWNLFEYGDSFFKQLIGTAMGTPAAVLWAIIYFYPHEKNKLIPSFIQKMPLLVKYIDHIFLLVLFGGDNGFTSEEWTQFGRMINDYGILKWTIGKPSASVNYLDLTVSIENGMLVTRTYLKPTNLFQYITPTSAHPPWMMKGIVLSMLTTYYFQNTYKEDYWKVAIAFYKNLKQRGWSRDELEPMFVSAHDKLTCPKPTENISIEEEISSKEQIILHLEYHPSDFPKRKLREIWDECCMGLLSKKANEGGLGIKKTIIAYSRPRNIREMTQKTKLHQHPGKEVSTFF